MTAPVSRRAGDLRLVLHVGLHKTATTFVQNTLSARRYDLLDRGVLYPTAGTSSSDHPRTREGAQSGHILFTRPGKRARALVGELLDELPESASTVLLSSEEFTRPDPGATPAQHIDLFSDFGSIDVVLVLRRQDRWIESYYKQLVDQYGAFEVRSFAQFLAEEGPSLLDFHARLGGWRELVGPERLHVLSYDDLPDGAAITRRLLEVAGIAEESGAATASVPLPRYDSVRAIDTLGLRLLNSYRIGDRDLRNRTAREIYAAAPAGDIALLGPAMRAAIVERCAPVNERIEREWCTEPVPAFRFGADVPPPGAAPPDGPAMVRFLDDVLALCESARVSGSGTGSGTRG